MRARKFKFTIIYYDVKTFLSKSTDLPLTVHTYSITARTGDFLMTVFSLD